MLLDVPGVLIGAVLAAAGFAVVVFVTALVLRLIGVVLGDGDDPGATGTDEGARESGEGSD
ncbi:MAG: hypothetical protein ACREN2_13435 [Candidatus Dormibacteria bacterium]